MIHNAANRKSNLELLRIISILLIVMMHFCGQGGLSAAHNPAVACFDHEAFARAVVRVLNDPAEYARLQNLGRACASQYDWDAIAAADSSAIPCSSFNTRADNS